MLRLDESDSRGRPAYDQRLYVLYTNLPFGYFTSPNNLEQVSITLPHASKGKVAETVWRLDSAIADFNGTEPLSTRATIATLSSLGIAPTFDETQLDSSVMSVFAYNCSFYFCVQGYFATASFGKSSQQRVPTTAEQMRKHGTDGRSSVRGGPDVVPADLNAPDTASFTVSGFGLLWLSDLLSSILNGNTRLP